MASVPPASHELLRCSFCGKAQAEVRKLIAGPTVFICDECVAVCVDIMKDPTLPFDPAETERWRRTSADMGPRALCSLCGTQTPMEEMLAVQGRGWLCGACADAVDDALGAGTDVN